MDTTDRIYTQNNILNYDITCCICLALIHQDFSEAQICDECERTIIHTLCLSNVQDNKCPKCRHSPLQFSNIRTKEIKKIQ